MASNEAHSQATQVAPTPASQGANTPASQEANTPASQEAIDLTNVVSDALRDAEEDAMSVFAGSDFDG